MIIPTCMITNSRLRERAWSWRIRVRRLCLGVQGAAYRGEFLGGALVQRAAEGDPGYPGRGQFGDGRAAGPGHGVDRPTDVGDQRGQRLNRSQDRVTAVRPGLQVAPGSLDGLLHRVT